MLEWPVADQHGGSERNPNDPDTPWFPAHAPFNARDRPTHTLPYGYGGGYGSCHPRVGGCVCEPVPPPHAPPPPSAPPSAIGPEVQ